MTDKDKKRLLITGFGPFPGQPINPSAELAGRLAGEFRASAQVATLVLPTEYKAAKERFLAEIGRFSPDIVVCFGVAANADAVRIERRACNYAHPDRPDAAGRYPETGGIVPGGAEFLESGLDLVAMAADMAGGISDDAGDYLCNFIYYTALHQAGGRYEAVFIHIPDPAKPGRPGMDALARGAKNLVRRLTGPK